MSDNRFSARRIIVSGLAVFASVSLLAGGVASGQLASAAPVPAPATTSVASARGAALGSVVTVSGTVTTPSGAFESSFYDRGFGVQDRTAGIYVSAAENPNLAVGTAVTVTGTLADQSGLLVIKPTTVSPGGPGAAVTPQPTLTRWVGEGTEGRLVTAYGRVTGPVVNDLPYGFKFTIDDFSGPTTIFLNTQTGIDPAVVRAGSIVQITGFSSQYTDHYEIDPRFPSDVRVFWK